MIPVVGVAEMREIDADAPVTTDLLIDRAGRAVAAKAVAMLGGVYGRRVVVVAGKGNNGADGRVAARHLGRRGVRVIVVEAGDATTTLPRCDLVIDAAYGTGFHGDYVAPDAGGARVLAVDIPSGVNGDTGAAGDHAVRADATVTFAALKPGLLLGRGRERAGEVDVADIGLDTSQARAHLVEDADLRAGLPRRPLEAHKWQRAVLVVAGSGGMLGAASLTARAALRAGAGMVRLATPGARAEQYPPAEFVGQPLAQDWAPDVVAAAERFGVVAIGPGLGQSDETALALHRVVANAPASVVVDADGLNALASLGVAGIGSIARRRGHPIVLTPHEGEFARLAGMPVGDDRVSAVRDLARQTATTVLLKGSTTVVASPGGQVLMSTAGRARLATPGTGDVLTGVIAAFLAAGLSPLEAAGFGAHAHGRAASLGHEVGLVAGDLLDLVPRYLSDVVGPEQ